MLTFDITKTNTPLPQKGLAPILIQSTLLKNKGASKGSSQQCHNITIFGSANNHSDKGSLKNHLFLTFFIVWRTFFHHKEPFVKLKGSSDVKGSLWKHLDQKVFYAVLLKVRTPVRIRTRREFNPYPPPFRISRALIIFPTLINARSFYL